MKYCQYCGAEAVDGANFCPACGKNMTSSDATTASQQKQIDVQNGLSSDDQVPQPNRPQNQADSTEAQIPAMQPSTYETDTPVSVGNYVGILILYMLPLVNLVIVILLACGVMSKNRSLINFGKASLVILIIGIALSLLFFSAFSTMFSGFFNSLSI